MDLKNKILTLILMINILAITILDSTLEKTSTYFCYSFVTIPGLHIFLSIACIISVYLLFIKFWKNKIVKICTVITNSVYAIVCIGAISSSINHFNSISNNFVGIMSHLVLCITFLITLILWLYFVFIKSFVSKKLKQI